MGYELDNLMKMYGVGTASKAAYTGSSLPSAPPADTASASDKAAFDEAVRRYQLDRKAYEQYVNEYGNRISSTNPYSQPQFSTTQEQYKPKTMPWQPPSATLPQSATLPASNTVTPPPPRETLMAPSYGAISQFSNLTPQQQGNLYKQQRDIGYTDADIRKATAAQIGTPSESNWTTYLQNAYPEYAKNLEQQYGTVLNRTGFGSGANQIDNPGYNYWMNQLSTGAVPLSNLPNALLAGSQTNTSTGATTGGTTTGSTTGGTTTGATTGGTTTGATTGGTTTGATTGSTTTGTGSNTTVTQPSKFDDISSIYTKYFGRAPDAEGLAYWSNYTGNNLQDAILAGAQGSDLSYYNTNFSKNGWLEYQQALGEASAGNGAAKGGYIQAYAGGGPVRTHYQTGGASEVPGDPLAGLDEFYRNPAATRGPPIPTSMSLQEMQRFAEPVSGPVRLVGMEMPGVGEGGTPQAEITPPPMPPQIGEGGTPQPLVGPTAEPTASTQGAATPAGGGSLQDMLARYMRASTSGGSELADARRRYQAESDAFYGLIRQMAERGESPTSRAEMYFRLASAFGSPTRTGSMGETLSKVGEQMSEYTKGRRADEAERRNLMVQAQQARMAGAREDLTTTRALAAQEATERRTLNAALLQEYIRSGQPQSNAGRMARDAGLTPGTQAFQEFVNRHADLDVQRAQQLIQAQNENIALRREAADRLSSTEIRLADETSQNISSARDNALLLREAIRLNPNASPSNLTEGVITDLRARLGSTDPLVVNTRDIRNILSRMSLGSLKETFPGAISNDERRALEAVSGVTAASREERARIMQRASDALERIIERNETQLRRIRSGAFGRIEREQGGTQ